MLSDIIKAIVLFFDQVTYWEGKYDAAIKTKQTPAGVDNAETQAFNKAFAARDDKRLSAVIDDVLAPNSGDPIRQDGQITAGR
jgi:hypothetical protein